MLVPSFTKRNRPVRQLLRKNRQTVWRFVRNAVNRENTRTHRSTVFRGSGSGLAMSYRVGLVNLTVKHTAPVASDRGCVVRAG